MKAQLWMSIYCSLTLGGFAGLRNDLKTLYAKDRELYHEVYRRRAIVDQYLHNKGLISAQYAYPPFEEVHNKGDELQNQYLPQEVEDLKAYQVARSKTDDPEVCQILDRYISVKQHQFANLPYLSYRYHKGKLKLPDHEILIDCMKVVRQDALFLKSIGRECVSPDEDINRYRIDFLNYEPEEILVKIKKGDYKLVIGDINERIEKIIQDLHRKKPVAPKLKVMNDKDAIKLWNILIQNRNKYYGYPNVNSNNEE